MSNKTPILFLIFNRPEPTAKVFEAIRQYRPTHLYIAADGPRKNKKDEAELCKKTREIALEVDWECEVNTLLREDNLGCKWAVSSGINWFFENVEAGIVLEDDCVPTLGFFDFCTELLERYKDDEQVMHIAGCNHHPEYTRHAPPSYYFSYYGHMWGWASWRRAWERYDIEMKDFEKIVEEKYLENLMGKFQGKYLIRKLKEVYYDGMDTWDYQWDYSKALHKGLTIIPRNNLVENIGFGEDATHTFSTKNQFSEVSVKELKFPLQHPDKVERDRGADMFHFRKLILWIIKRKLFAALKINGYDSRG